MKYPYKNLKNFTLKSLLERSAELYPQQPALSYVGGEKLSYENFYKKVLQNVEILKQHNIKKGDKVVLLAENMPHWAVAYFAVTYFGGVVVPVLVDFHASDIHHIIRHSQAKAAYVSSKYQGVIEDCEDSQLQLAINLEDLEPIEDLTNKSYISQLKEIAQKITKKEDEDIKDDDLAAIIYTSGTTGHSKGVMLSHKNITTNALSTFSKIKITSDDIFLSILPLAHTLECTVGLIVPILHGASVQYIKKAPTPSVLLKALSVVRPTMMLSVPLIIEKIYKNKILPKFTSSAFMRFIYSIGFFKKQLNKIAGKKLLETFGGRLRFFGIGGAPISPYVEEFLIEADFPYIIGYGLTETAPLIAGGEIGKKQKLRSTGTPFYGVEVKILKENENDKEGEIITKSPSVMLGYYKDEEQTAQVINDGWFYTGDLGYLDEEGYLFISGRSKNMLLGPSGENIYPEQIEATINQQNNVLESLLLQKDGKLVAKLYLDNEAIDKMFSGSNEKIQQDIENYLEEMRIETNKKLASFCKISKFVQQREPFVKTPTKKIKRYLYI